MKTKMSIGNLITLVFKGIALAMGVAVVVTGVLGSVEMQSQITMLGIGLFSIAIVNLDQGEQDASH